MGLPHQQIYYSRNKTLLQAHAEADGPVCARSFDTPIGHSVSCIKKHGYPMGQAVSGKPQRPALLTVPLPRGPGTHSRWDREIEMRITRMVTLRLSREQPINISRLVREEKIPYSVNAVSRCLKRHGMYMAKRRKRKLIKKDFREFCQNLPRGLHLQIDIKYLSDIKALKNSIMHKEIPLYQITARDRGTGLLWFCYTYEKSTTNTTLFLEYLLPHLRGYLGADMPIRVQTDNGKEFTTWFDSDKGNIV